MSPAVEVLDRMLAERGRSTTALAISIFLRGLSDHREVIKYLEDRRSANPKDPHPSVFLVQIHCWSEDRSRAEVVVKDMILRFSGMTYADLLARIQAKLPEKRLLHSRFVSYPKSTMQNIGFFEHQFEECSAGATGTLITKMTTNEYSGTEIDFYDLMRLHGDILGTVAPAVIDVMADPTSPLCFLTMEKVAGSELVVQEMSEIHVDLFIATYAALELIDHRNLASRFWDAAFEIGHSHAYLVSTMRRIHEKPYFDRTNAWLLESVRTRGYSQSVVDMVSDMIGDLGHADFSQRIDPAVHYSLLHGDLHRFNVLQDQSTFKIIDWGKCTVGPRGIDLAVLFRRFPFTRMIDILERNGIWERYAQENKVLFAYALVLVSVMIDLPNIKEEPDEQMFKPATDFIAEALRR